MLFFSFFHLIKIFYWNLGFSKYALKPANSIIVWMREASPLSFKKIKKAKKNKDRVPSNLR
jgi:hypothetical protein